MSLPAPSDPPTGVEPNELPMPSQGSPFDSSNSLRGSESDSTPPPSQRPEDSIRSLLENDTDIQPDRGTDSNDEMERSESPASPSDLDPLERDLYQNPFDDRRRDSDASPDDEEEASDSAAIEPNELSCEEFRDRIARETIDRVTLDISPPFRPDLFEPKEYEKQRNKFDREQQPRTWSDINGSPLANGRLVDLAYEKVVIQTGLDGQKELPLNRISEGDLAFISENWGLPKECLIEQVAYTPRSWTPMTMTWKASNICSKQRYYEQVNLERYGHTAGPWLQPIVSSAHFFANIAITPYKMGIHPPNECHYALGYYRPGNCAPWIVPPFPISPRGALVQGAVMSGLYWLIP